jgi:hypothetical protein
MEPGWAPTFSASRGSLQKNQIVPGRDQADFSFPAIKEFKDRGLDLPTNDQKKAREQAFGPIARLNVKVSSE